MKQRNASFLFCVFFLLASTLSWAKSFQNQGLIWIWVEDVSHQDLAQESQIKDWVKRLNGLSVPNAQRVSDVTQANAVSMIAGSTCPFSLVLTPGFSRTDPRLGFA